MSSDFFIRVETQKKRPKEFKILRGVLEFENSPFRLKTTGSSFLIPFAFAFISSTGIPFGFVLFYNIRIAIVSVLHFMLFVKFVGSITSVIG